MTRILSLLPILALAGLGTGAPNAARKCGALLPGGKPLMSIDGVITQPATSGSNASSDDVYSIDIVCMDPTDSTFNRMRGVAVVSVWTKRGPAPRVAEALDVIRQAQDTYFASHGRYISALEEIRFPESLKSVRVTMEASAGGWTARTTLPRLLRTCVMFDGTVAAPPPGGPRKGTCERD